MAAAAVSVRTDLVSEVSEGGKVIVYPPGTKSVNRAGAKAIKFLVHCLGRSNLRITAGEVFAVSDFTV